MNLRKHCYIIYLLFTLLIGKTICYDTTCSDDKLSCDRNKCIPYRWLCDGTPDCDDGTDELKENCPLSSSSEIEDCKIFQFKCNSGICIPRIWRCDGADDCGDGTDEFPENCEKECVSDEFRCTTGQCIDYKWHCDGRNDCIDGSDEANCTINEETSSRWFDCSNGFPIPSAWQCDGTNDCEDSSDEEGCIEHNENHFEMAEEVCFQNEYRCPGSFCIQSIWLCNGLKDCLNGEDEKDCPSRECTTDEFKCADGNCLRSWYKCDGINDCNSGSDEVNCRVSTQRPNTTIASITESGTNKNQLDYGCNLNTHFLCKHSKCISRNQLCNDIRDCSEGEDESFEVCGNRECHDNNGGCIHNCVDTKDSYYCTCDKGFRKVGKYNCEDINECKEISGICSQTCTNIEGGYHCSCLSGYMKDPRNYTRCKATQGEVLLLFSHSFDIRQLRLRDQEMRSIVGNTRNAIALDYSFADNEIFWSEKKARKILRTNVYKPKEKTVLLANRDVSADGLAVDWIHRNIYFTDNNRATVSVASWSGGLVKTLVSENMTHPRAIVVTPIKGYIYWTDWGLDPKIERAYLDGTNRTALISNPKHVRWPNGLTIDHTINRIYWCDGLLKSIFSSDLDGNGVEVILYSTEFLNHPFSVSVFEDRLYWTDWSKLALFSADKFTGSEVKNVSSGHVLEAPKVVHVYHQFRQPYGQNFCKDHICEHFCLWNLEQQAYCACADGHVLKDNVKCIQESEYYAASNEKMMIPYKKKCIIKSESIDLMDVSIYEDESYCEESTNLGFLIGGIIIFLVIAILLGVYVIWIRNNTHPIRRMLFPNQVYMRTTEDYPEGGGLIISQDPIYYAQSSNGIDGMFTDADDVPLAPKRGLV